MTHFNKILIATLMIIGIGTIMSIQSCNIESKSNTNEQIKPADLIQRGDKIQLGKEWDDVQSQYQSLTSEISKDSDNNEAKIALAQLYIREARVTGEHGHYYPAALNILEDAIESESISDDLKFIALTTKAGVQLSLHEFDQALQTGNMAVLLNPNNAQIHGVLVDANVELGNYDRAVALADRMMAIKPDIRSYSRVSYLREIHGDVEGSIKAMDMAVRSGFPGTEETAWAMLTLGDIYRQYARPQEARKVYEAILEMRENYPFAVGALGNLYVEMGDEEKAEATLKEAMDIIPEVGFYISLAELYKMQGKTEAAKDLTDEILVMLKEDTDSGHNMNLEYANVFMNLLDDPQEAMVFAQEEYAKRPQNIDVNRTMAKLSIALDNIVEVDKYLQEASKTNSKHPELQEIKKEYSKIRNI